MGRSVTGVSAGGVELLTRHHCHEGQDSCCTCGGRWPCIPAMHLEDQIAAFVREHGGIARVAHDAATIMELVQFIRDIYGDAYEMAFVVPPEAYHA